MAPVVTGRDSRQRPLPGARKRRYDRDAVEAGPLQTPRSVPSLDTWSRRVSDRGGDRSIGTEHRPGDPEREDSMAERVVNARDVTLDEVRARAAVAGVALREERLEMVRLLLADALAPLRRVDTQAVRTVEPA